MVAPSNNQELHIPAAKDEHNQRPIPTAWRRSFTAIVGSFVRGDHSLSDCGMGVGALSPRNAEYIRQQIEGYGGALGGASPRGVGVLGLHLDGRVVGCPG
jgi:hypothetical protein